ncbi:elongation of very long chain fatty acids protein AAEL008004-like [Daktulosphaira vitifoliae]|uniref:elongation of very long chain fatty acids protein AAEL008004-like n=1 Tax=Daktulosphaira vitifoliae TaxID=58002 RepID=UPI0021A9FDC8|nr:elongation of very long chain fatty acids protein AAEL008004-like [Daktulosphaira vitifoliae]XP_050520235.1 elongation of very long chain fatty acids protein AAEL008004-like [Daktulosphaira vitifoliae]XP_050520236.1 elongation of very long chain fatty acids protein AAEL008004-like [Daktulosphaira vitifoliae]XP_050520237.1 elongation of very long chain fatty acids protein AAEL008004-like [Daktulosphaira vitifoliae]
MLYTYTETMAIMTNITQKSIDFIVDIQKTFKDIIKKELRDDEKIDNWLFMSNPWLVLSIITVYLLFILKIGPILMKNRKPFNLKYILLLYNIFQVIYNGYLVLLYFITPGAITYHYNHLCHPLPRHMNQFLLHELDKAFWYFFLSKLIDLSDTIFFVLRKKQSQVTFLHIYHHVNMVITCWFSLKYIKDTEQLLLVGLLNSFVHVIMYSYYFLSALGPHMAKYLWWKKYLTSLQIAQFVLILAFEMGLFLFNCTIPVLFMMYIAADVSLFLYLFLMFYKKSYKDRKTINV